MKRSEIKKIAEKNPKVDLDQLRKAERLVEELRARGVTQPQYDLATPYEIQPPRSREAEAEPTRRRISPTR